MKRRISDRIILFSKEHPIDPVWINKWDNFLDSHPGGPIFQSYNMFRVYIENKRYEPYVFISIDKENDIQGLLFAVIQKEYNGLLGFLSSRTLIIGGPLVSGNNIDILDSLLEMLNRILGRKSIFIQFRNFNIQDIYQRKTFAKHKFRFSDHLNIILDLRAGKDVLWDNLSRSRRKGIKKAMNEDFVFEYSKDVSVIPAFYHLLSISYKRIKLPFPGIDHFYSLASDFNKNNYSLFLLKHKGVNIAILFALIYKNTVYGYYAGSNATADINKLKPMDFFFWELIKWAVNNNMDFYDWMGAGKPNKQYGVRDFKLQFGGELVNLGRYEKINYSLIYVFSKLGLYLRGLIKSIS
jgi:serine/alanine adding enzyme